MVWCAGPGGWGSLGGCTDACWPAGRPAVLRPPALGAARVTPACLPACHAAPAACVPQPFRATCLPSSLARRPGLGGAQRDHPAQAGGAGGGAGGGPRGRAGGWAGPVRGPGWARLLHRPDSAAPQVTAPPPLLRPTSKHPPPSAPCLDPSPLCPMPRPFPPPPTRPADRRREHAGAPARRARPQGLQHRLVRGHSRHRARPGPGCALESAGGVGATSPCQLARRASQAPDCCIRAGGCMAACACARSCKTRPGSLPQRRLPHRAPGHPWRSHAQQHRRRHVAPGGQDGGGGGRGRRGARARLWRRRQGRAGRRRQPQRGQGAGAGGAGVGVLSWG